MCRQAGSNQHAQPGQPPDDERGGPGWHPSAGPGRLGARVSALSALNSP